MPQVLCPVMVGRATELDVLTGLLDTSGTGLVLGEAGIGKSRLVRELGVAAQRRGSTVLTGRAVQVQPTPYRPLAEAVLSACRRQGLPRTADLLPYRPALGRLIPEWYRPELSSSAESSVILGEGVLRLLAGFGAGRPVLLVLEDLHWADPESLAVVEYLADHASEVQLACVVTARPRRMPALDQLAALTARRAATRIELSPLPPADVAVMARNCLQTRALPAGLTDLLARADGVPFLVEELLQASVDAGALVPEDGCWVVRTGASAVVPGTLAEDVTRRIGALDREDRDIPRAAAVLGRCFEVSLVAAMVERTAEEVSRVLDRCVDLQLMAIVAQGYEYRHALTREAVLAGLVTSLRRTLADRARDVVESAHPGLPDQWCERAAELSLLAGDVDDAARLLLTAGGRAAAQGALSSAVDVLARARDLVRDDDPVALDIDELRIEVAAQTGDVTAAFAIHGALLRAGIEPARRTRVHLRLAQAAAAAGRWQVAQEQLHLAAPADDAGQARVDALAAHVQMGMGQSEQASAIARRALATADRLQVPECACQALEVLGRVARTRDLREAEAVFARQLEIASTHGSTSWVLRAVHELGTIDLLATNDVDRLVQARVLAEEAGALSTAATVDLQLAASYLMSFQAGDALQAARRCQDAARRWNLDHLLAMALLFESRAHSLAGHRAAMEWAIDEAAALHRPEPLVHSTGWVSRAVWRLLREDHDGALAAYDSALEAERGAPVLALGPHWGEAALLRTVRDRDGDAAREELRPLIPAGAFLNEAVLGYGDAVAAGRAGQRRRAEDVFAGARSRISSGRGCVTRRHIAERLVAEAALADDWGEPVEWLTEAAVFFHDAGHVHLERACRSLLRRSGARVPRRGHPHVSPTLAALGVTDREADVLALVAEGLTSREIAARLYLSVRTVDKHVERLLAKTGAGRRTELRTFLRSAREADT